MQEDCQNTNLANSPNSEQVSSSHKEANLAQYHCQYMIDYINGLLDDYFVDKNHNDSNNHRAVHCNLANQHDHDKSLDYDQERQNEHSSEIHSETKDDTSLALVPTRPFSGAGLWTLCDNCETMLFNRFLKEKLRVCEECGYHLEMNSQERIELLIDEGSWVPMDETMFSYDALDFVDEEPYHQRLEENQDYTGLTDAIQTGTGKLRGYSVALGVMDFQFMGGSMGSVVGEKIARLIECATQNKLPLIIVCASGGARMQEGTLSLMQMAKIAAMLQLHQVQNNLLYISILTSPTTGGVTASFGMLGDIIIAEPNAYIAFAGKRIIQEIFRQEIPEGFQEAESLFKHGLLDLIIPRVLLKGVLAELFALYKLSPY